LGTPASLRAIAVTANRGHGPVRAVRKKKRGAEAPR
jgi:hypothetical protein